MAKKKDEVTVETAHGMRFVTTPGMGTRVQMVDESRTDKPGVSQAPTETRDRKITPPPARGVPQRHTISAPNEKNKKKSYGREPQAPVMSKEERDKFLKGNR